MRTLSKQSVILLSNAKIRQALKTVFSLFEPRKIPSNMSHPVNLLKIFTVTTQSETTLSLQGKALQLQGSNSISSAKGVTYLSFKKRSERLEVERDRLRPSLLVRIVILHLWKWWIKHNKQISMEIPSIPIISYFLVPGQTGIQTNPRKTLN